MTGCSKVELNQNSKSYSEIYCNLRRKGMAHKDSHLIAINSVFNVQKTNYEYSKSGLYLMENIVKEIKTKCPDKFPTENEIMSVDQR